MISSGFGIGSASIASANLALKMQSNSRDRFHQLDSFCRAHPSRISYKCPSILFNLTFTASYSQIRVPANLLFAGAIVKRNPIILRQPKPLELEYHLHTSKLMQINSIPYCTQFFEADRLLKSKATFIESAAAPACASDDEGALRRLDRKLYDALYLIIKRDQWEFPYGPIQDHETLREV